MMVVHLVRSFCEAKIQAMVSKRWKQKKQARIHPLVKRGIDIQESREKKAREKSRKAEQKEQGQGNPLLCWRKEISSHQVRKKEAGISVARD